MDGRESEKGNGSCTNPRKGRNVFLYIKLKGREVFMVTCIKCTGHLCPLNMFGGNRQTSYSFGGNRQTLKVVTLSYSFGGKGRAKDGGVRRSNASLKSSAKLSTCVPPRHPRRHHPRQRC